ncbi:hypothetical protein CUJ83_02680 [Methanocella sp. CWC-04]|uniref:Uncharacterized protein n=1 Tax=Methanooceanicella nereidis TaxID=2052831 RepID=A0AAP2RBC2_9EURY|nr:hypothetical protein [Methanocella sp. CWC-04]MCD1293902.1 hypothetical protein [Methanocella sp. CWC-04]
MSTLKKSAVLTMLVVLLIAFNIPASAQTTGISSSNVAQTQAVAATSAVSTAAAPIAAPAAAPIAAPIAATTAAAGFGPFGGAYFPFNWGFAPFGVGCFPFNYALGGGLSPFGLCWNKFSPCFGTGCGGFFSPCFLGGCGAGLSYLAAPFILGTGSVGGFGWALSPWAFGLGGCTKSAPLYFGSHGFGFPFTIGCGRVAFTPAICAAAPFILGTGSVGGFGWALSPWAFGLGGCTKSAPLYFGSHGFGFPFTIGCGRVAFTPPSIC